MTDDQLCVSFRNEQTLSTNSCECTRQNAAFDLETYGPYLDKIREIFVPSLEYRIHCLLEEFVYSRDSRWAMQFPYFKKFIDTIATWRDPLIKAAEYDIGTMEKTIRSTVKRVVKDDLLTGFLDSITLHYRLNKICRELDALGIEDNILRNLNVWNFVNENKYYRADHDYITNSDTVVDCNANSSNVTISPCDAKEPARCKNAIELAVHDLYCKKNIEQPTTSDCQSIYRPIIDANHDLRQQTEDDFTHNAMMSQNDDKIVESVNEEPCDAESAKIQSFGKRLKMIVRKMYPEDCSCPTYFGSIVTHLVLPCKPSDLIGRIFDADPSLMESCFIVMKRKFLISVYNVCSCLNDILGKLDVKFTKTLYLNCEIYPGYIRFRLKNGNDNKCLFVARIPICQNVRRRTILRNSTISIRKSKLSTDAKESKCCERCNDDDNDILTRIDEESQELDDTCCSQSNRNVKDTAINLSRDETGNENKEEIICTITECVPKCLQDLTTFCCNKSRESIAEEICDVTSHNDNSKEINRKCQISDSIEIDCQNVAEISITMTNDDDSNTRLIDDASCVCLLSENFAETNYEMEKICGNKEPDDFSQHDRSHSLDEKSNLEDEDCNINTCSIVSFVQNSEDDKQLVELNCNRFLCNDIGAIDKRLEDNGSLNSAKAEIGCDSCCFSNHGDDFIDITVIDNISSRDDLETCSAYCFKPTKVSSENDLLAVSVQTPRLRVSSKGISVNVSYPQGVIWMASGDDGSTSTKTRDRIRVMNPRKGHEILCNKRVSDKIRDFTKLSKNSLDISMEEYLGTTSNTSNTSRCCRSTSEFTASDRREEFEKSHKSARLSKFYVSSSNGNFRSVTSFTAIKCGTASRKDNDHSAKVRPHAILVMTKFRESVDRSVGRIKRLIHGKLRKILFNDGIKTTNASRNLWRSKESSEDTARGMTSGRCTQDYSITSCSTCNCCRHSCTLSSCESSNVILSIRRNRYREESKDEMKFRDRRLIGGSEALSTFRSIETTYDLLTPTVVDDMKKYVLSKSDRCNKEKRTEQNIVKSRNPCDFENYGTRITTSSQSAKVSGNDSKYRERYTCKQREETRDDKRVYEGMRNQDRWKEARRACERRERTHRQAPIKYSSNESLGASSSYTWRGRVRDDHKQSRSGRSRAKNTRRLICSGKNWQKDTDRIDDDRLRKKRVFGILTDICNDYTDDLDLDFKLHLLRYVELCRNVKRALMKTLQFNDDFYEVDTISSGRWRSTEKFD